MYETMLIVDDVEMERVLIKELLKDQFTIIEAQNGLECLDVVDACKEHIDVILLDLIMPKMNGFTVLEKRQGISYFKDIPVIVLTASGAVDDQVKAFHLGANDFITKPLIPDIIQSRVNNVLLSKRRLNSLLKDTHEYKVKSELDQMTCLYNKATVQQIIEDNLALSDYAANKMHAMFIVDIDNFKAVNDVEGHQVGDHTLKIIADLLSSQFRNSDIVGRIGGDEFIICMFNLPSKEIARIKAHDIVMKMKFKPNLTIPANVTLSIGLAFSDGQKVNYNTMFEKADKALQYAKKNGKAQYHEYGIENKVIEDAKKEYIILLSRNRSVCSLIESIFPKSYQFITISNIDELCNWNGNSLVKIFYIDVSDMNDQGESLCKKIESNPFYNNAKVIVLCEEGNLTQYKNVISSDFATDILSVPIEYDCLQRRTAKLIGATSK